ncbi:4-oxalocrotonate tautomerase [Methanoculleus sp. FWC-SCC1]|uniref:4-oxalocrotonate tautomerase n=1 Tax=Methanoculleus frigidifontis TaxID=2584085 RepID=A0ABT8MAS2_9EURY|nr:tautomerase family protein [Methanoculleus sp. FWC-SCC1]MDN7024976.1 4-oxalocrotonate tautomerase [Methanoculleus sp. FWC-SCC1]
MPVVTIQMSKGKTLEQKRRLAEEITATITSTLGVSPDWVTILIEELDRENIAKSGKLLSES